jgi:hypothetical protein
MRVSGNIPQSLRQVMVAVQGQLEHNRFLVAKMLMKRSLSLPHTLK